MNGMKVTISIECQRCHAAAIETGYVYLEDAEEHAEAKGWICTIWHGWTCPACQ